MSRKYLHTIAFISLFILFASCEKAIIPIPATLYADAVIGITGADPNNIDKLFELDASTDPDIKSNLDLIESYEISSVSYQIVTFSGFAGTTFSGNMIVGNSTIPVNNLNLIDPTLYTMPLSAAELESIATDLLSDNKVQIRITGNINNKPTEFRIKFTFKVVAKI